MQDLTLLLGEIVTLIVRDKLDDHALREIGGLIEQQAAVPCFRASVATTARAWPIPRPL